MAISIIPISFCPYQPACENRTFVFSRKIDQAKVKAKLESIDQAMKNIEKIISHLKLLPLKFLFTSMIKTYINFSKVFFRKIKCRLIFYPQLQFMALHGEQKESKIIDLPFTWRVRVWGIFLSAQKFSTKFVSSIFRWFFLDIFTSGGFGLFFCYSGPVRSANFGFGVQFFPPKSQKKSHPVRSKNTLVKDGSASYFLRVKSMLGSSLILLLIITTCKF